MSDERTEMNEPKTWREAVRRYWPEATDQDCNSILHEETSWPYASPEELKKELADYMATQARKRKD